MSNMANYEYGDQSQKSIGWSDYDKSIKFCMAEAVGHLEPHFEIVQNGFKGDRLNRFRREIAGPEVIISQEVH